MRRLTRHHKLVCWFSSMIYFLSPAVFENSVSQSVGWSLVPIATKVKILFDFLPLKSGPAQSIGPPQSISEPAQRPATAKSQSANKNFPTGVAVDKPARLTIRLLLFLFLIVKSEVKKQIGRRWHCLPATAKVQTKTSGRSILYSVSWENLTVNLDRIQSTRAL